MSTSLFKTLFGIVIIGLIFLAIKNININIKHSVESPHVPSAYTIKCNNYIISESCDITLTEEIKQPSDYSGLFTKLVNSNPSDEYRIHLVGYGGYFITVKAFESILKQTKAKVIMIVDGPVYSAHAFIATLGNKLIINKNNFMMFHDIQYNPQLEGTLYNKANKQISAELINKLTDQFILTKAESALLLSHNSNEVYVFGSDLLKKFKNPIINGDTITIIFNR